MFKTILKTVALSATTLTLLSACGALADLNTALHAPIHSGELPPFERILTTGIDGEYRGGYPNLVLDPDTCYDCEFLTEEQLVALEKDLIAKSEEALIDRVEIENAELKKADNYYLENWHGLSEEDQLAEPTRRSDARSRLAKWVASEKALIAPSAKRYVDVVREMSIRNGSLLAEQARWDASTSLRVTYEPAPVAVRAVSINATPRTDSNYNYDLTKANDTLSLVLGEDPILTINGVDYELVDRFEDPLKIAGFIYKDEDDPERKNRATLLGSHARKVDIRDDVNGTPVTVRDVVNGTHPTVQGDYFQYTTREGSSYEYQDNGITGIATIGIQTTAAVVAEQTAVAIYRGEGFLGTYKTVGPLYHNRSAELAIDMSVDFDANTIEGMGRRTELYRYGFLAEHVIFNSAPIVGNGFEGTFTLNSESRDYFNLNGNPTGQYSGNFFGPNANDLAGVMSFDSAAREYEYDYDEYGYGNRRERGGTITDIDVIGIGGFRADRTVIGN